MIVSCEHAGNAVPEPFLPLFKGYGRLLRGHRGYDIGALELTEVIAGRLGDDPYFSPVTRLLVDLNRSPDNPRRFSEISRRLTAQARESLMERYYWPYRRNVEAGIGRLLKGGNDVLHLSVHTFTPVLDGNVRFADIGLLYDAARRRETLFCARWKRVLNDLDASLNVRRNYPYSGRSDGFTSYLRSVYGSECYLGIELEVNQKLATGLRKKRERIQNVIAASLVLCLGGI